MGETIYTFVRREIPGAFQRAWALERDRLQRTGHTLWSLHNEILQPALMTLALWTALVVMLGWSALVCCVLIAAWANFQLTSANYIEHYGLLRKTGPNGRAERCQPHHSWNSNHVFSNWIVFHLQRHSDHHAHPARRYPALRHFRQAPQLPSGYAGMVTAAYFPPLWYALMDHRVVAHYGGDLSKANIHPPARERIYRRWQG